MLVRAEEVINAETETCHQKDDVFPQISKEEYSKLYHLMEQLYGYELSPAEIKDHMVTHVVEEFKDYLQTKSREEDLVILSGALQRLQAEKVKRDAAVADDLEFALLDALIAIRGLGTDFVRNVTFADLVYVIQIDKFFPKERSEQGKFYEKVAKEIRLTQQPVTQHPATMFAVQDYTVVAKVDEERNDFRP
jgi:hypothetical protein